MQDNNLSFNGYQANFSIPGKGLFLFTHTNNNCNSTIAVKVKDFYPLYHEEIEEKEFAPGATDGCPNYCLDTTNLSDCGNKKCSGSVIRRLMQIVKEEIHRERDHSVT
ncbi:MAG: hypothetical protein HQK96_01955 [Nitrospirae bacterium]|nr:hypothetical protein [Nitrospirota bacterium]MBF0553303.1 hypothetical protein [Nitrospirota bacterium]